MGSLGKKREEIIDEIEVDVSDGKRVVLLSPYGMGKTRVLQALTSRLEGTSVTLPGVDDHTVPFIIDEIATSDTAELVGLATIAGVVAATPEDWFGFGSQLDETARNIWRTFRPLELGPLTRQEIEMMPELAKVSGDTRNSIISLSEGWPRLLRSLIVGQDPEDDVDAQRYLYRFERTNKDVQVWILENLEREVIAPESIKEKIYKLGWSNSDGMPLLHPTFKRLLKEKIKLYFGHPLEVAISKYKFAIINLCKGEALSLDDAEELTRIFERA